MTYPCRPTNNRELDPGIGIGGRVGKWGLCERMNLSSLCFQESIAKQLEGLRKEPATLL